MERRKFIKACCHTVAGIPLTTSFLQSCGGIYYATTMLNNDKLIVAKSEFIRTKRHKEIHRKYVLIKPDDRDFPICLYKMNEDNYVAALLMCTHRSCELNVGGGIYSCPCHGSEFSITGKVLEGPADKDLKTFKTETDHENIYIILS